jgi:hypothetical protein
VDHHRSSDVQPGVFKDGMRKRTFLLKAKAEAKFPGDAAPLQFRLKDPGTETVIAICNATGVGADGIECDFKTRQLTPLGNYRELLTQ